MIYKVNDKCWSIDENGLQEHVIEEIRFTSIAQMIKFDGQWHCANCYFSDKEEAMHAQEQLNSNGLRP